MSIVRSSKECAPMHYYEIKVGAILICQELTTLRRGASAVMLVRIDRKVKGGRWVVTRLADGQEMGVTSKMLFADPATYFDLHVKDPNTYGHLDPADLEIINL